MPEIILHHYWPSPVAEKVRVTLGFKQLTWQSVEIPRVPPKPDVVALTGGYRRTPVMQIGADIYCDSQCIIRELERRYPGAGIESSPRDSSSIDASLFGALAWGLSRWTDGELFTDAIRVVLGSQIDTLDKTFLEDRARLYFGPDWTRDSIGNGVQHSLSQIMTGFSWMDSALQSNQPFLAGDLPGLVDACCYHVCWFVRGRFEGGPAMLSAFPTLVAWEERVASIGYGTHTNLDSGDAIAIANSSEPEVVTTQSTISPSIGKTVLVRPTVDGGDPEVEGTLVLLDQDEIVVRREDSRAGVVHVHFPRIGYWMLHNE